MPMCWLADTAEPLASLGVARAVAGERVEAAVRRRTPAFAGMTPCFWEYFNSFRINPYLSTGNKRSSGTPGDVAVRIEQSGGVGMRPVLGRRLLLAAAVLTPLAAHAAADPTQPIRALDDALLGLMRAGPATTFAQRMQSLTPVAQRAFDLPLILRNSVGLRWNGVAEAQRQELLEVFTRFTVAILVSSFDAYSGERFEIDAQTRPVGQEQVVQTRIVPASGDPTRLDYVMRDAGNGVWKAVDVLLDGSISRVAVQRSDFRSLLASGDPAPLIASLRDKVAGFAASKS